MYLANLTNTDGPDDDEKRAIEAALSELTPADQAIAEGQRICPVTMMLLGSMGTPPKVDVNGTPVFICCEGCRESLLEEPVMYLAKLATADTSEDPPQSVTMDFPPIGVPEAILVPEIVEPQRGLPQIEAPQAINDGATESQQAPGHSTTRAAGQRREDVR